MASLGVSFTLPAGDQVLVQVDLSATLGPFDSIQFILYPWAMPFFQMLFPVPLPPN